MAREHRSPAVRAYKSPLRKQQAAATRLRVLSVAGECFGAHGYPNTTLRDIARAAGVSLDTVQAQGSKAQLFLAAFDLALVGEDQALPLREQENPELREAFAGGDLEGFMKPMCAYLADSNRRSAALWRAFVGATAGEPLLDEAYAAKMDAMRAEGVSSLRLLISRGVIKAPANLSELADELWMTAHVAQYHLLAHQAGWPEQRYLAWLTESMIAAVRRHCAQ
ncbi:TetR/AcrR family transcriptional regulator [Amycolatopsis sp. GM8]|uniref:TetR/AcrR family transcriptional regulator n=1 Tax=Amycolatopsis sp. GM8 TaxID=2896530 RepID=UPI001F021BF6|nr:TetR family transcriptional regulator [Amycolatopsis sp. GM8]